MPSDGAHANAAGMTELHHGVRNFADEIFLDLEPARVGVDQARQLAEAEDPVTGLVGEVDVAEEWQEVVRADRMEFDVANFDEAGRLVGGEHSGGLQDLARLDLVTCEQLFVGAHDAIVGTGLIEPAERTRKRV